MPAPDYLVEIVAIQTAIAAGTTHVSYEGKSVEYDDFKGMLARLAWLQRLANLAAGGPARSNAIFTTFDRD